MRVAIKVIETYIRKSRWRPRWREGRSGSFDAFELAHSSSNGEGEDGRSSSTEDRSPRHLLQDLFMPMKEEASRSLIEGREGWQ